MNLALGTVLVVLFITPGFLARFSFLQGEYARKRVDPSTSEDIFFSITLALIAHIAGFLFVEAVFGQNISLETVYLLLSGAKDSAINFQMVSSHLSSFLVYILSLNIVCFLSGVFLRRLIIKKQWHQNSKVFKLHHDWYTIFTNSAQEENFDLIIVDVAVESSEGMIIYSGVLKQFFTSKKESTLDRIILQFTLRRRFKDDKNEKDLGENSVQDSEGFDFFRAKMSDPRYYRMPGDLFVIPGSQIKNMNITYINLQEVNSEEVAY